MDKLTSAADYRARWTFEVPPEPIAENEIKNTVEGDVIVIGSGVSGLITANSALDEGLDVVLISASSKPIARGGSNAASWSKAMESAGYPKMNPRYLEKEIFANGNSVDQKKWYKWYNHSPEAFNYVIDYMESRGYKTALEQGNYIDEDSIYTAPVISHSWVRPDDPNSASVSQDMLAKEFADRFTGKGGRLYYKAAGYYFEKDENGRVVSVIAKDLENGAYLRFTGRKAVVIAAGDFSKDQDMMAKYASGFMDTVKDSSYDSPVNYDVKGGNGLYCGDMIKAALWAGAAWQKNNPCCVMLSNFSGGATQTRYQNFIGLLLDMNGERFMNEYCSRSFGPITQHLARKGISYAVWDSRWAYRFKWYNTLTPDGDKEKTVKSPEIMISYWDSKVKGAEDKAPSKAGYSSGDAARQWFKADTIEELVRISGLPHKAADTIRHYNEMCAKGEDTEYYKNPKYLYPIEEGPFYCQKSDLSKMNLFTVLGGPRTNSDMQVCDENDDPIPGLYIVGSGVGDMFSGRYTFMTQGAVYGACCITFGYLLGKFIAENE